MKKHRKGPTALILVGPGFEEKSTITCLIEIRESGAETKLLGLTAGLLVGAHGLTIRSDITLADLELQKGYKLIVLPGSSQGNRSFLADPRTIQLLDNTLKEGGWIAVMNQAESAIVQSGLMDSVGGTNVIYQGGQGLGVFVERLINLVSE